MADPAYELLKPASPTRGCRDWARLLVVWLCCTVAAGIIPGQAVFAAMFADAGVYAGQCEDEHPCSEQLAMLNSMFYMGVAVVMVSSLPVGIIFDLYGGRVTGTLGSCAVCIGLLLEAIPIYSAINGHDEKTNWLVPVAAIVTDFGSILNSYCFFGLIWHYPGSTTVILSLATATYQVSALLPLVLQKAMDYFHIHLGQAMVGFAVVVFLSARVIWSVSPTQQEYYDKAKEVLGVPLPKPKLTFNVCDKMVKGWHAVRMDCRDHVWLCCGFGFSSSFAGMYAAMSAAYGKELFGSKDAGDKLAHMQVIATATVGAIAAPLIAKIIDRLGLQRFAWMLTCFVILPLCFFWKAAWWAALLTTVNLCLFTTLYNLFMSRYFLHYAPPNRIGSYSGVFQILMLFLMMPFMLFGYIWMSYAPKHNITQQYFYPYFAMGSSGLLFLVVFNVRFCFAHDGNGVPKMPHLLPEDEIELAAPFGVMNLDEAAIVVSLDKPTLLKKLSDPDPETLKALLCQIDTDKMDDVMSKHGAEDMIKMLEMQPEAEEEEESEDDTAAAPEPQAAQPRAERPEAAEAEKVAKSPPGSTYTSTEKEATPLLQGEQPSRESGSTANVPQPDPADGGGREAASPAALADSLATRLREAFRQDAAGRKRALEGDCREPDSALFARALADCLEAQVREGDVEGVKCFLLEVLIEDQWNCFVGMEDYMDDRRSQGFEKKFGKLIPGKVFAGLVKQRPELADLVKRLTKRGIKKSIERFRGKSKK